MRNSFFMVLLCAIPTVSKVLADTTSAAADSAVIPFSPPSQGPLGIDNMTGLALYGAAILFAVLVLALLRKNTIHLRK